MQGKSMIMNPQCFLKYYSITFLLQINDPHNMDFDTSRILFSALPHYFMFLIFP